METEGSSDKIRTEINAIQKLLRADEETRKQTRWIQVGFTLGVILLFVVFGWSIFSATAKRFEQKKITQVLQEEIRELSPDISKAGEEIVREVVPVYRDVFLGKFQKMQSALCEATVEEATLLNEHLLTVVLLRVTEGLNQTFEKQMATLFARVPGLDEESSARVLSNVMTVLEKEASKLIGEKLLSKHIVTIDEIGMVLQGFDTSDITVSGDELTALLEKTLLDFVIERLKAEVAAL